MFTDPKRALKNRIYNRTTRGCLILLLGDNEDEIKAMPAAVLAIAKDPAAVKGKAVKARAFVEECQRYMLQVLAQAI